MDSKLITDAILESMRKEVAEFVETQGNIDSSSQYEERVLELSRKFALGLISHRSGKLPKSRNSKKSPDESGPD